MEWQDEGLILGSRKHGENSVILELMTQNHGRHLGIVRGGRSTRLRPVLQVGNKVSATWRARLEDHLGVYQVEPILLRAAELISSQSGVYGVQMIGCHLRLLAERDSNKPIYDASNIIIDTLSEPQIAARLMIEFELALLNELGFGLDLQRCADTGTTEELVYVSPRSGRAVSRASGLPWHNKMLRLPPMLSPKLPIEDSVQKDRSNENVTALDDLKDGFKLTGFFLDRHVYVPRNIKHPSERHGFIKTVLEKLESIQN